MKLVSYELGQILYLVPMDEVRPLSGMYAPDLIKAIGDRYALAFRTTDLEEAAKSGLKFQVGRLTSGQHTIFIKQLDVYNDGVLISTHNCDETEIVFAELSDWLKSSFGFREPISQIRRKYFSSVVIDFDKPLEPLFGAFSDISNDYAMALKSNNNVETSPSLYRIAFASDPRTLPQFVNTQFLIERRNNSDFVMNRYIATAPLSTKSLLSLLERIESRL